MPRRLRGALLFSDERRNCIWSVSAGRDGEPRKRSLRPFETPSHTPVDLLATKHGIYYPSIVEGTIRRISYSPRH